MDVSQIGAVDEDGGVFEHFRDAAGNKMVDADGSAVGAVVSGTYSKYHRDAQTRWRREIFKRVQADDQPSDDDLAEREDEMNCALEAVCIRSWTFTAGGVPYAITPDNWRALYSKQPQWRAQVRRRMNDHAGFSTAE